MRPPGTGYWVRPGSDQTYNVSAYPSRTDLRGCQQLRALARNCAAHSATAPEAPGDHGPSGTADQVQARRTSAVDAERLGPTRRCHSATSALSPVRTLLTWRKDRWETAGSPAISRFGESIGRDT